MDLKTGGPILSAGLLRVIRVTVSRQNGGQRSAPYNVSATVVCSVFKGRNESLHGLLTSE